MVKYVREYLRQRKCDHVVRIGERQRELAAIRSHIDGSHPHTAADAAWLDHEIDRLERKREKLVEYIKNTAPREA